jgi:DNA-directed RNA polymerase beta subunit
VGKTKIELIYEDIYTSIHIEKYEIEAHITRNEFHNRPAILIF